MSAPAQSPAPTVQSEAPSAEQATLGSVVRGYVEKVKGGDVGSLPAVLGLVLLVVVFSILRPDTFTNERNFASLIGQSSGVMVIAMGLVFVLLLGEIDLSAGFTGGVAAAAMCIALTNHDWNVWLSLLVGLLTGTFIGFCIGLLVARVGIPSFVVTLAMFLGLQGVLLKMIGEGGTIGIRNEFVINLNNGYMSVRNGWIMAVVTVAGYGLVTYLSMQKRRRQGLVAPPLLVWVLKTGFLALGVFAFTWYLSQDRGVVPSVPIKGVPKVVLVILVLTVVLGYLLNRTAWGRHVYAVGGNAEAARRAGINVAWVKLSCFMMCSTMAAVGGILLASRTNSVSPATGGRETLLLAVGAAVIGGTSLFGGKGRVTDAVIGGLVIAVINNGMGLLNQPAATVFMVSGGVLLLAASVDAISRRRASATGRA